MTATSVTVRKHVKPAHAGARIPDPAHRGRYLPAEGSDVTWDHYWINRERHGDVVVSDIGAPAATPPAAG